MEPKITLTTNGTQYDVQPGTLKNWADVMCSLTRSDYGGVVRKFTSQFEFVGETKQFLFGLYMRDEVEAECDLAIFTMTDNWEYVKEFECPLDFSTIQWDDYVLTISSVDNSLASLIKANKGTKYEMIVGEDIISDGLFRFDRLPMKESATYEFTQGDSDDETGAITVHMSKNDMPWLGNVANEISVGQAIHYKDDQDPDDGGFLVQAYKDTDVELSWIVDIDTLNSSGASLRFYAEVFNGSWVKESRLLEDSMHNSLVLGGEPTGTNIGSFADEASLPTPAYGTADIGKWATVSGIVWIAEYNGRSCYWKNTEKTVKEYFRKIHKGSMTFSLTVGDKIRIVANWGTQGLGYSSFALNLSSFVFSWCTRGDMCDVPAFAPKTLGEALLKKIAGDRVNATIDISLSDRRLVKTRLMAAESIRAIPEAKLYSSFGEFCDWMETVFGYTYWIGEREEAPYKRVVNVGSVLYTPYSFVASRYNGEVNPQNIVYIQPHNMFFYYNPDDERYYISFDGWEQYMRDNNRPLMDVVYNFGEDVLMYFTTRNGSLDPTPKRYAYGIDYVGKDIVTVHFVHRSELFTPIVSKTIENVKDLVFKVKASQIYSSVVIGYDKKDYDSINGRDEFNFNITYSTGSRVSDKKFTLQSKYRADCYGMEFAAQKRGKSTTDSDSDQDVFFAYCVMNRTDAYPDRTAVVENALSDQVFNAAFSPMACVRANAGYIGMQSRSLRLAFASSTGNSSIVIDNEGLDSDITLDTPLLSCAEVEFSTDDQNVTPNINDAVRVISNGIEYVGFIADLDLKYFRKEAAKYKLIVKSVTPL